MDQIILIILYHKQLSTTEYYCLHINSALFLQELSIFGMLCVLSLSSLLCHIITAEEIHEYIQTPPAMREDGMSYSWFGKLSSHVTITVIN